MIEDGFLNYTALLHCGIYALLRRGVVVYIGQSKALGERIRTHIRTRHSAPKLVGFTKKMVTGVWFDEIWVRPCMLAELDVLEMQMIKRYQPKYNVKGTDKAARAPREPTKIIEIPEDVKEMIRLLSPEPPPKQYMQRRFL